MNLDLDQLFSYHPPQGDQAIRYNQLREAAKAYAQIIRELSPASAEQTLAIRAVHLASMHANSAIAVHEA